MKICRRYVQGVISVRVIPSNIGGICLKHEDNNSYDSYKQYLINRYKYEQEQFLFPIAFFVGLTALFCLLKYILYAIAVICAIAVVVILIYFYLKKQLKSDQTIILSKEEAKEGAPAIINVIYEGQTVSVAFDFPPNVNSGQKFVAKNILLKNKKGKNVKKNLHFKVQVL